MHDKLDFVKVRQFFDGRVWKEVWSEEFELWDTIPTDTMFMLDFGLLSMFIEGAS